MPDAVIASWGQFNFVYLLKKKTFKSANLLLGTPHKEIVNHIQKI